MTTNVEVKVHVPPRRRSATIQVMLDEQHQASAVVNARSIRLTVKTLGRYGQSQAITIPRDPEALVALEALLRSCRGEIADQEEFQARDAEERGGVLT